MVKITRITIETESVQIVYRRRTYAAWCPVCCSEVDTVMLSGLGEEIPNATLARWLASGRLHCRGPDRSPLQICLKSLLRCFESEDAGGKPDIKQDATQKGEGQ